MKTDVLRLAQIREHLRVQMARCEDVRAALRHLENLIYAMEKGACIPIHGSYGSGVPCEVCGMDVALENG